MLEFLRSSWGQQLIYIGIVVITAAVIGLLGLATRRPIGVAIVTWVLLGVVALALLYLLVAGVAWLCGWHILP